MEKLLFVLLLIGALTIYQSYGQDEDESVEDFIKRINNQSTYDLHDLTLASWAYDSNLTDENLANQIAVSTEIAKSTKAIWQEVTGKDWANLTDNESIKRQLEKYAVLGAPALTEDKMVRLNEIIANMSGIYAKATICDFYNTTKCDLLLEPDLEDIFQNSRNASELQSAWVQWRDAVGPKVRDSYVEYVQLEGDLAKANDFEDYTAYLLTDFDDDQVPDFRDQVETLWQEMKPFYIQLHGYVRHKLREQYGSDVVSEKGPIPAHLLGNMWAQTWENIATITLPYPDLDESVDITKALQDQGYTVERIFETAEAFFYSLGMDNMTDEFWDRSIIERPEGIDLVCHASAWDFYEEGDYRIKECTEVNSEDFYTTHHEMGHIQYFMQYKDQPFKFRDGANSGFHEAVGDLIALSVQSTKHLQKLGLMKDGDISKELDINNLYKVVLEKVAFLPFSYIIDMWRWNIYSGKIAPEDYNCEWWKLRQEYQGLEPPVDRSEDDFDPAAKYHVVADVPYIRYFVSFIVQFQFHEALCLKAGEYDPEDENKPLHNCDIFGNAAAGDALREMLSMGSSEPWSNALLKISGERNMTAEPLLAYIKPVKDWIEKYNKDNKVALEWEDSTKVCTKKDTKGSASGVIPSMTVVLTVFIYNVLKNIV